MKLGICGPVSDSAIYKAAGADFLEVNVQSFIQPAVSDAEWRGVSLAKTSALPLYAANVLMPGDLRIVGPDVDLPKLKIYLARVMQRSGSVGLKTIVFGSGGARRLPDGFPMAEAKPQLIAFARAAAEAAQPYGITIVVEPLNRTETNTINSVAAGAEIALAGHHPNLQLLADSYHVWKEREPVADMTKFASLIRHVHVADDESRLFPGVTGNSDYRAFFAALKAGGYTGPISIEAGRGDLDEAGLKKSVEFVRSQWDAA